MQRRSRAGQVVRCHEFDSLIQHERTSDYVTYINANNLETGAKFWKGFCVAEKAF